MTRTDADLNAAIAALEAKIKLFEDLLDDALDADDQGRADGIRRLIAEHQASIKALYWALGYPVGESVFVNLLWGSYLPQIVEENV